jgi:ankyrin repeat protein
VAKTDDEDMLDAVSAGNLELAAFKLDHGANINATRRNDLGVPETALKIATTRRDKPMCMMLMSRGIDMHQHEIVYASQFPNILGDLAWDLELTKMAIERGADPFDRPLPETTILHNAYYARNEEVFQFYIDLGIEILPERLMTKKPSRAGEYTQTLVHGATGALEPKLLKLMLDAGARPDVLTGFGMTPLHECCNRYRPVTDEHAGAKFKEIVKLLLDAGLHIDQRDRYGNTALHYAVGHCPYSTDHVPTPEFVTALLEAGADPSLRNKRGERPVDVANDEIVELLRSFGCDESLDLDEPVS